VFKSQPRQSKVVTGFALGVWLFAVFVGVVHACSLGELGVTPGQRIVTSASACSAGEGMPVGCEQFCASDVPVVSKVPSIGEQSAAQLPIAAASNVHVVIALPPAFSLARAARPPSGVPPILHFTRLRL
jgi:hypothetical protein